MTANSKKDKLKYNELPKKVSRKEFNLYVASYLRQPVMGPKPKISIYKTFNYILYVLLRPPMGSIKNIQK